MKKTFFILFGSMLLIIMFLLTMKLFGYNFNKDFLGGFLNFNKQQCIKIEYPTYDNHSGIAGCVFWSRHDYLEITQDWRTSFKRDDAYCNQKYKNEKTDTKDIFKNIFGGEYGDPKCTYEAYRGQKRRENWDYLVSTEQDKFYKSCVNRICSWPPIFK